MPLPSADTTWPPNTMDVPYRAHEIDDAWFTGDEGRLETVYANPANQGGSGLFGGIRRWFHGTPNPMNQTQPPVKLHLPVPAEIARMSASLLFGEMFTALFESALPEKQAPIPEPGSSADTTPAKKVDPYEKLNTRLKDLLDDNAHARFLEAGEYASAHGGSYLKVAWNKTVHPQGAFLVAVAADTVVPEFQYGNLTAATVWARLAPMAGQHYLLLERHEPGRILYGLYESAEKQMLGHTVPLDAHPDAAALVGIVDESGQVLTGTQLLTIQYLPNVKPNKKWRRDPLARNFGRSDFDGAYDVFDAVDENFTGYMREFRLSKARLTVPKGALTAGKPGQGASFNADQEIYVELGEQVGSLNPEGGQGTATPAAMELFQPQIREQEYRDAIQQLKEWAYEACGYSAQTFGSAGDVAITATEVTSREKLTILSRAVKILAARPALELLLAALIDVDYFVFGGTPRPADLLPTLEWPDAASDSPKVVADMLQALNLAQSASIRTRVSMLHPDWSDDQIDEEVQRIRDDDSMLPMPNEKNLWAAVSENGTSTGGVQASSNGIKPGDPSIPVAAADAKKLAAQEDRLDGAAQQ